MPPTHTSSSGSGSEHHPRYAKSERTRASSRGSASVRSHPSSASRSLSSTESWDEIDEDEVDPVDDVTTEADDLRSRSRAPSSTRRFAQPPVPDAPQPSHSRPRRHREPRRPDEPEDDEPASRHNSTHRHHRVRRHHHRVDSRRVPSDESTGSTVGSQDDYPYGRYGMAPPRGYPHPSGYRHVAPGAAFPPPAPGQRGSVYGDPFALVPRPHADPFGYSSSNPFSTPDLTSNPFSPMSSGSSAGYFATEPLGPQMPHLARPGGPPRPSSFAGPSSHFAGEMIPGYGPYAGFAGYPPVGWPYGPPLAPPAASPPPRDERQEELERLKERLARQERDKREERSKNEELEALKSLIQKHEEARVAREKELFAKAEAEAAMWAAIKAKEEEEKKRKEEIAAASKSAKEAAEKAAAETAAKAKEEADAKVKALEEAKAEAEKKQKALEEEAEKNKPPPDHTLAPIKFKDAVGRKFSFPFHLCKTWKGMEGLIKQAFLHVDVIGEHVQAGHYDLTGPDGEIILPQVWDTMIKPDWDICMHMWPMPESEKRDPKLQDPLAGPEFAPFFEMYGDGRKKRGAGAGGKKGDKKKKAAAAAAGSHGPIPVPPPPGAIGTTGLPAGVIPDPLGNLADLYGPGAFGALSMEEEPKADKPRSKKPKGREGRGLAAWFAGGGGRSSRRKR